MEWCGVDGKKQSKANQKKKKKKKKNEEKRDDHHLWTTFQDWSDWLLFIGIICAHTYIHTYIIYITHMNPVFCFIRKVLPCRNVHQMFHCFYMSNKKQCSSLSFYLGSEAAIFSCVCFLGIRRSLGFIGLFCRVFPMLFLHDPIELGNNAGWFSISSEE